MNQEEKKAPKPDVVLSDGTAVFMDKHNIKPREWKSLFDPEQSEDEAAQIIARFTGLDFDYVLDLSVYDSQLLYAAMAIKIREQVVPNSASVSTSP